MLVPPKVTFPCPRISRPVLLLVAIIACMAVYGRKLLPIVSPYYSGGNLRYWILSVIFVTVGVQLFFGERRLSRTGCFCFLVTATMGVVFCLQLAVVEERIHVIKYGSLAFLCATANPHLRTFWASLFALLFATLVGVSDELIQSFVPGRVGDPRDVLIDLGGAFVGIVAFVGSRCASGNIRK